MIVRSTECISGASREAIFSGEAFHREKWKTAFVSCLLQRARKNFPTFNFLFHPLRKIKRNWNFTLRRLILQAGKLAKPRKSFTTSNARLKVKSPFEQCTFRYQQIVKFAFVVDDFFYSLIICARTWRKMWTPQENMWNLKSDLLSVAKRFPPRLVLETFSIIQLAPVKCTLATLLLMREKSAASAVRETNKT